MVAPPLLRFADLNGDRYADYLVVGDNGAITAYLNNGMDIPGGGGWAPQGQVAGGSAPLINLEFADFNNDNRADYLIVNHTTGALDVWLNNGMDVPGGGGWINLGRVAPGVGVGNQPRRFADINGDGAVDYLLINGTLAQTDGFLNNGGDPL